MPLTDGKQLLVPESYIRHLISLANQKMEANWARADRFHGLFRQRFLENGSSSVHGSQEAVSNDERVDESSTDAAEAASARHAELSSIASMEVETTSTSCSGGQCQRHLGDLASETFFLLE